jgi:hypothetical protein
MTAITTQQQHPKRAAWRTAVQTGLSVLLTLGVVLPAIVAIVAEEFGTVLPEAWLAWLVGAAGVAASVSAALARIMAIPGVDAALKRLHLSSSPAVDTDLSH